MNSLLQTAHDEKVASLAASYVKEGFDVIADPTASQLPFNLGNYVPDLVATKDDVGLIVDVRTTAARMSVDRLQSIAEQVAEHPGWRFMLVTLDDVDSSIPTTDEELPTWQQLKQKLQVAREILATGAADVCLLYLWGIFEAALRRRALVQIIPVERLQAKSLVNHMYSKGEISVNDLDLIHDFLAKSNRIAHGANQFVDAAMLAAVFDKVGELLEQWSYE